jgi:hypothetical protein
MASNFPGIIYLTHAIGILPQIGVGHEADSSTTLACPAIKKAVAHDNMRCRNAAAVTMRAVLKTLSTAPVFQ